MWTTDKFYEAIAASLGTAGATDEAIGILFCASSGKPMPRADRLALGRAWLATQAAESKLDGDAEGVVVDWCEGEAAAIRELEACRTRGRRCVVVGLEAEVVVEGLRTVNLGEDRAFHSAVESAARDAFDAVSVDWDPLVLSRYRNRGADVLCFDFKVITPSPSWDTSEGQMIVQACRAVCQGWRFDAAPVEPETVIQWVRQFGDRADAAIELLENLRRKGYLSHAQLRAKLLELYELCVEDVGTRMALATAIQRPGKSEGLVNYLLAGRGVEFRGFEEVVKFVESTKTKTVLVCFDDFLCTGGTLISCLFPKQGDRSRRVQKLLMNGDLRVEYLVGVADSLAIKRLNEEPRMHRGLRVRYGRLISDEDRVFAGCDCIQNESRRRSFESFCVETGKRIAHPREARGYRNLQWNVVSEHSVPNATLPIVRASGDEWTALFPTDRPPGQRIRPLQAEPPCVG